MISSKQNSLIKEIRSLSDKKNRDSLSKYFVEGVKMVQDAIDLSLDICLIVGTEKGLSLVKNNAYKTECVTEEVFLSISSEKSPQGVICVINKPKNFISSPTGSCLLLDDVADPTNVGAIIRTAVSAGYTDIYMTKNCADPFSPKATRCSMTGIYRVNIMRAEREELLKAISLPIYVADMTGENVFTHKPNGNFCLVIGNEGHGVSPLIKEKANVFISIPMLNGLESLNASLSAGLLMYELKGDCWRNL